MVLPFRRNTWGFHAEQKLSVNFIRNNFNRPKRKAGDSAILLARLMRLAENVRKVVLPAGKLATLFVSAAFPVHRMVLPWKRV